MHWIVLLTGLSVLWWISRSVDRSSPIVPLSPSMDAALSEYMASISRQTKAGKKVRVRIGKALLSTLEKALFSLHSIPDSQLLPAARHLICSGRFLQEEAANLFLERSKIPQIPLAGKGQTRLSIFAREMIRHCSAEITETLLDACVAAWQSASPLTNNELQALPFILKKTLLDLIADLSRTCISDQQACLAARQVHHLQKHGSIRKARKLFSKFCPFSVFQERLFSMDESQEWLLDFWRQHGTDGDTYIQQEHQRQLEQSLWIKNAVESLRSLRLISWDRVLERWSTLHQIMQTDDTYPTMDLESRAFYRERIAQIAGMTGTEEQTVASMAMNLSSAQKDMPESHVGYYLIDEGLSVLARALQCNRPALHLYLFRARHACGIFRLCSWAFFLLFLYVGRKLQLPILLCIPFGFIMLYSLQQAALKVFSRIRTTRRIPKIELDHLTANTQTLVICPVLLRNAKEAIQMVRRLSIMHEANPDEHLHFLLLGDFQDSISRTLASDTDIILAASAATKALCEATGHSFFYFQRERFHISGDSMHRGRAGRCGSVQTLLKILEGRPVEDSFAYTSIDASSLHKSYRYVIVLDENTTLPPQSALQMVGAMLHPLLKRQKHRHHMRGTSIIRPSVQSAPHATNHLLSPFLSNGYHSQPSLQHWLGRATFEGTGIIDPGSLLDALERNIPDGRSVNAWMLEGELGKCAAADDIVLYDEKPCLLGTFLDRLSFHVRSSWYLLPHVCPLVPSHCRPKIRALDLTGRFKIWHELFISLLPLMRLILLAYGCAFGKAWLWFAALLLPQIFLFKKPYLHFFLQCLCSITLLPCKAAVATMTVLHSLFQMCIKRSCMADGSTGFPCISRPPMFLFACSAAAAAGFGLFCLLPFASTLCCLILALVWMASGLFLPFLEQEKHAAEHPTRYMREVLTHVAKNTLTYFETIAKNDELIPSHIQIDPNKGIASFSSATDIGWYMISMLCCEKLKLLNTEEMGQRLDDAMTMLESLPVWHGLPYQKYDARSYKPLHPCMILSEPCAILASCLLSCAQGVRMRLDELDETFHALPARMDAWVGRMSFHLLFDPEAERFHVAYHPAKGIPSDEHHDMLADESQLLSFVSIMLRQAPLKHWQRLCRQQTRSGALISHHGSMAEYLVPLLFEPLTGGTLLDTSAHAMLQMQYRHRLGGAFGISQSACYAFDADLNHLYAPFGLPQLAIDPKTGDQVLAPYACFLSMPLQLKRSFRNLLRLQIMGLEGPLGMFEAADFDPARIGKEKMRIIRSHKTEHQGMILCAICNVLENGYVASLFSSLPKACAYRFLLEEPSSERKSPVRRVLKRSIEQPASFQHMQREAMPLRFPVDAHLFSGAETAWLIDAQGGGFLMSHGIPLTKFRPGCHTPSGMRIYLRDSQSGAYWTITDPYLTQTVRFESSQAVFVHTRFGISCETRMWVNPLDGSAIHCITLENQTDSKRMMEICSYLEPALDQNISTERLGKTGIAAHLPASAGQESFQIWQTMHTDAEWTMVRLQSDRSAFLGRGRSFHAPRALEFSIGAVADSLGRMVHPCLSIRGQFLLPAHAKQRVFFITHLAKANENHASFMQKYAASESIHNTQEPALTRSMVFARFLNLDEEEQVSISRITGALCYWEQPFQGCETALSKNELKRFNICLERPLLLVKCDIGFKRSLISLLLKTHAFFRLSGYPIELVIAVLSHGSAHQLLDEIEALVHSSHCHDREGIHMMEQLSPEEWLLLKSRAHLVLECSTSLDDQLASISSTVQARPLYSCRPSTSWKSALPPAEEVLFFNGYGGFTKMEENYQIMLAPGTQTPLAWCNPLIQPHFCTMASESGLVYSECGASATTKAVGWSEDFLSPRGDEAFYLQDQQNRLIWSMTRQPLGHGMPVRVTFAPGEALYECSAYGIYGRLHCLTDSEYPLGLRIVQIRNDDQSPRRLMLVHSCIFSTFLHCTDQLIQGYDPQLEGWIGMAAVGTEECIPAIMSAGSFQGLWNNAPYALTSLEKLPVTDGNAAALSFPVLLDPGESRTFVTVIGFGSTEGAFEQALQTIRSSGSSHRLHLLRRHWTDHLTHMQFDLPDQALSILLGRWLPYQARAVSRKKNTDALSFQDGIALLYTDPGVLMQQLDHAAKREHHTTEEQLSYLYAVSVYTEVCGFQPDLEKDFLQSCFEILESIDYGSHGLPLNNENGDESVWLAMILCEILRKLTSICKGDDTHPLIQQQENLLASIERYGWDGAWYLSGWDANGHSFGSRHSETCQLDLLPQVWSVLCGVSRERCSIAMEHAWQRLYDREAGVFMRSAPFDENKTPPIAHTCLAVAALLQLGEDIRAWEVAFRLLPTIRSATRQTTARYRAEPYVMPGLICIYPQQYGVGMQTWQNGNAGCYMNMMIHQLLGLRRKGDSLRFCPVVPKDWDTLRITYNYGNTTYHLHASRDCETCTADGETLADGVLRLKDDGRIHEAFFPLRS